VVKRSEVKQFNKFRYKKNGHVVLYDGSVERVVIWTKSESEK